MLAPVFLDDSHRLRTIWRFSLFGCAFAGILLIVNIAAGIAFALFLSAMGQLDQLRADQLAQHAMNALPALTAIVAPPMVLAVTILVVVFRRWLDRRSVSSMGLDWPSRREFRWLPLGFLLGMAPILAATWYLQARGEFVIGGSSGSLLTILIVPALLLMAFEEELVFRGYLLRNLIEIRRPVFGVVFTSLAFWLVHSLNPHVWSTPWIGINLFGAGVVFALAYQIGNSLWFCTVMHFAWNFTQGVVFDIPVSGVDLPGIIAVERAAILPEWVSGGEFGLEGSAIIAGLEAILVVALLIAQRVWPDRTPPAQVIPSTAEIDPRCVPGSDNVPASCNECVPGSWNESVPGS